MSAPANEILIRPGRPQDLDDLTGLLYELFSIEADFQFDRERQRKGLALMLGGHPQRTVLVAEKNEKVIAMCSAQTVISTAEGGEAALVEDVVVTSSCRGLGLGKKLMAALEKWAADRGIQRLQLLADQDNSPALAFYDRLGWQPTRLICRRRRI